MRTRFTCSTLTYSHVLRDCRSCVHSCRGLQRCGLDGFMIGFLYTCGFVHYCRSYFHSEIVTGGPFAPRWNQHTIFSCHANHGLRTSGAPARLVYLLSTVLAAAGNFTRRLTPHATFCLDSTCITTLLPSPLPCLPAPSACLPSPIAALHTLRSGARAGVRRRVYAVSLHIAYPGCSGGWTGLFHKRLCDGWTLCRVLRAHFSTARRFFIFNVWTRTALPPDGSGPERLVLVLGVWSSTLFDCIL